MWSPSSLSDGPSSIEFSIRVSLLPLVRLSSMCLAILSSSWILTSSLIIQMISNLEASAGANPVSSYALITLVFLCLFVNLPSFGLAAARIAHLEFRVAVIPPLATWTFCCSIAGCIILVSSVEILSNSSIAASPRSESGSTPASRANLPSPNASLTAAAVSPAPEVPPPVANLPLGERFEMNVSSCDLATPGSPMSRICMSPLDLVLSFSLRETPPKSCRASERLTRPIIPVEKMEGAMDC